MESTAMLRSLFDGEDDCVIAPAVELARSISAFSVVRGGEQCVE
jgi:hypothetical protein